MKTGQRLYRLDLAKLRRLRLQKGLTEQGLAKALKISRRTLQRVMRGSGVMMGTVARIAKFFDIADPTELLAPEELDTNGEARAQGRGRLVGDWEVTQIIGPWETASNTLQWRLHRLTHLHLTERFGRGKLYDLGQLSDQDRQTYRDQLTRHPEVCGRIGQHPNIAVNLTALPDRTDGNWWVIDQWIEGVTLEHALAEGTLAPKLVPGVLRGIAEGLAALHRQSIVRRELSPQFILLREQDATPVLTDFELAKLLDANRTVANRYWQPDPYRAAEVVAGRDIDERADLYSWGRIAVHALGRQLPKSGSEEELLKEVRVPAGVRDVILACVRAPKSERPREIAPVLAAIKGWK
ncbi:MAG: protein kinase [Pirellulales bacterium]|nr:protein kinase [Pirellulales bacterium]